LDKKFYFDLIEYFYIIIIIIGLIIGVLNFIPSSNPEYNSVFVYLICEWAGPIINNHIGWIFQNIGYSNFIGNLNTFTAQFGLSYTNINIITWGLGALLIIYSIMGVIGINKFKRTKKSGWTIIFIMSIPLSALIIGLFFLNYLIKKDTIKLFN